MPHGSVETGGVHTGYNVVPHRTLFLFKRDSTLQLSGQRSSVLRVQSLHLSGREQSFPSVPPQNWSFHHVHFLSKSFYFKCRQVCFVKCVLLGLLCSFFCRACPKVHLPFPTVFRTRPFPSCLSTTTTSPLFLRLLHSLTVPRVRVVWVFLVVRPSRPRPDSSPV